MGPYDTEQQAAAEPMPRRWAGLRHAGRPGCEIRDLKRQALLDACAAAGVQLGNYDRRVLDWLAGWEPTVVQAIAGIISRANR